jgi:hypothetical protein
MIVKNALHVYFCGLMQFYAGFMRMKCTFVILITNIRILIFFILILKGIKRCKKVQNGLIWCKKVQKGARWC